MTPDNHNGERPKLYLRTINEQGYGESVEIHDSGFVKPASQPDKWPELIRTLPIFALVEKDYAARIGVGRWFSDWEEGYEAKGTNGWKSFDNKKDWEELPDEYRRKVLIQQSEPLHPCKYCGEMIKEGRDESCSPENKKAEPQTQASQDEYYPGKQYQRLFNAICDTGRLPLESEMQDIIQIVHEDFPVASMQGFDVAEIILNAKMDYKKQYYAWLGIKQRCFNKKNKNYCDYGGRGIILSDEFKDNFPKFLSYLMTLERYEEWLSNSGRRWSLDRIDNDGNYSRGNIRLADKTTQNANTRIYKCNKSGFKGVRKRGERFEAIISRHGIQYRLGHFDTPEEANKARQNFGQEYDSGNIKRKVLKSKNTIK